MKDIKPTKAQIEIVKKKHPNKDLSLMTVPMDEAESAKIGCVVLSDMPRAVTGNAIRHLAEGNTEKAYLTLVRNMVKWPEFKVINEQEHAYILIARNLLKQLPQDEYIACDRPEKLPEGLDLEALEKQESLWKVHWFHIPCCDFYFAARFPGRAVLTEYERESNVSIAYEKLITKSVLTDTTEILNNDTLFFAVGAACNSLMPSGSAEIKKL